MKCSLQWRLVFNAKTRILFLDICTWSAFISSFGGLSIMHDFHAILQQNPSWNCWRALPPDQLLFGRKLLKSRHLRALVSASHSCCVQLNRKGYHFAACVLCNSKKQIRCNSFLRSSETVFVKVFFENSLSRSKEQLLVSLHT